MSTIALITITAIILTAVMIAAGAALLVRATRRRRLADTPDYWREAARACELEWSASHRD